MKNMNYDDKKCTCILCHEDGPVQSHLLLLTLTHCEVDTTGELLSVSRNSAGTARKTEITMRELIKDNMLIKCNAN